MVTDVKSSQYSNALELISVTVSPLGDSDGITISFPENPSLDFSEHVPSPFDSKIILLQEDKSKTHVNDMINKASFFIFLSYN
jgi:hypothetical protein